MTDLGDKAKERFFRTTQPPEVEGVKIDWSPLPHPAIRDLRGMRFGKLLVKAYSHTREQANGIPCVYWLCQCDCGNDRPVARDQLLRKGTSSCGCLTIAGNKGVLAASKTHQKRSHMTKRVRHGLPPVAPIEVIGDPANVFAYDSLMAYACLQWAGYEPAAHHHLIAKYLEKVEKGKIKRLMIFLPPRAGKSMVVSEYFPAWYLGRNPDKRIIATSYGQDLASDFGRKVRNQIADPIYGEIFPNVGLSGDSAASDKFDIAPPHKGGYFAVGVGGAITGRGANCLPGDTKILTSHGIVDISDILRYNTPLMALSFSEKDAAFIWSPIVAVSRRKTHELVRVVTDRGSIVCTPEHPFYIEGVGYVEAKNLTKGQGLCVYGMSPLRKGISERPAFNRESEGTKGELEFLLFWDMQARSPQGRSEEPQRISTDESLFNVQTGVQAEAGKCGCREVLLKDVCVSSYGSGTVKSADSPGMQVLWKRLLCQEQHGHSLFESVRRQNPLGENAWGEQSKLSEWIGDRQGGDEKDDARDYGERWVAVCRLPRNGKSPYPSYRPQSGKQRDGEYGDSLPIMPYAGTQDRRQAAVCMVEPICNGLVEVYDIEVLDTHNFVALNDQGTPLVLKNCLIIDDPIKSREDSDSEATRRKIKDWYTAVAYTRLMDNGAIIICQTRWHTDDLSGWLLREHKHEKWTVLNLPAINEQGEALWPEHFPLPILENIRKTLPARDWEALYQQKPFIEEGNIYKRQWWNLWPDTKPLPECEFIIQSWDTAYSDADRKKSSYSARVTLGVFKRVDDEFHNIILIEYWKGRVEYPELRKESLRAYQDYEPDKVIIEKKASGNSLIQDLRRGGLPLATYTPEKDKITRAYAAQSLLENGRLYYPARKWAEDFISALARFPNPDDDDVADAFSQAIIWLQSSFLVAHADDAKRRQREDAEDEDLPSNVTRFKPKKKRAAYG